MRKRKKLYEGKAKILYETDEPQYLIQEFKDDATAFNGKKKGRIANKGYVNNQVSGHIFRYLASYYVPNHFVDFHSDVAMVVRRLDMILVEVVVRNIAAGSFLKRTKHKEGDVLPKPVIEFYLKDDALGDPQITEKEIFQKELCTPEELETIRRLSLKINALLKSFFGRRNIQLVDFKLEFGRTPDGKILLADEISP
ncbi:MAG: phosphoribosylaminoimidazolesuccinocarboxamide synthase, partial [Calditrichaeota bacterium]